MITEDELALRIETLRLSRSWSYGILSQAMADAGCPMERSSLQKIERAKPRRKITVDEMSAFARAFGLSVGDLLDLPAQGGDAPSGMSLHQSVALVRISRELLALTNQGETS